MLCEPWVTVDELDQSIAEADRTLAAEIASDVLWRLSGHRWPGSCTAYVRPLPRCGGSRCRSVYRDRRAITLGHVPILSVEEVKVDGVVLDPELYRIDDDRLLVRLPDADGTRATWPCCPRLDLPDTEEHTFSVAFTYGGPPPVSGRWAARELAGEIATKLTGGDCQLDDRVRSVTREGITMELLDPAAGPEDGWGLASVSSFLHAVNPNDLRRRARVVNPDQVRSVVRPPAPPVA